LQKSVLVIEDSPSQAALTRIELEKMGYLVEIAYDGAQGLEKARSFGPSVIILDCNLPKMSGVEVCKVLKTQPETRSTPVVMFSAENKLAHHLFVDLSVTLTPQEFISGVLIICCLISTFTSWLHAASSFSNTGPPGLPSPMGTPLNRVTGAMQ